MNKATPIPSKAPTMMGRGPSRRQFLRGTLAGAGLVLIAPPRARAAAAVAVEVPSHAVGAIVAAVGGSAVSVSVRDALGPTTVTIAGEKVEVGKGLLLKGSGAARARFLDDARNASKLAVRIRDALSKADPQRRETYQETHKAWSKAFAHRVLRWELALKKSALRGRKLKDVHGRVYLLEWAGAVVTERSKDRGPAGLAQLPERPSKATPEAYGAYVDALVAAVS